MYQCPGILEYVCVNNSPHFLQPLCLDDMKNLFGSHWGIREVLQNLKNIHIHLTKLTQKKNQIKFRHLSLFKVMWALLKKQTIENMFYCSEPSVSQKGSSTYTSINKLQG